MHRYFLSLPKPDEQCTHKVIYKEIWVRIMMIEDTIFAWLNTILSNQNVCLLSYNTMEKGLVKSLLDQDDRANKFCPIIWDFARSYRPQGGGTIPPKCQFSVKKSRCYQLLMPKQLISGSWFTGRHRLYFNDSLDSDFRELWFNIVEIMSQYLYL